MHPDIEMASPTERIFMVTPQALKMRVTVEQRSEQWRQEHLEDHRSPIGKIMGSVSPALYQRLIGPIPATQLEQNVDLREHMELFLNAKGICTDLAEVTRDAGWYIGPDGNFEIVVQTSSNNSAIAQRIAATLESRQADFHVIESRQYEEIDEAVSSEPVNQTRVFRQLDQLIMATRAQTGLDRTSVELSDGNVKERYLGAKNAYSEAGIGPSNWQYQMKWIEAPELNGNLQTLGFRVDHSPILSDYACHQLSVGKALKEGRKRTEDEVDANGIAAAKRLYEIAGLDNLRDMIIDRSFTPEGIRILSRRAGFRERWKRLHKGKQSERDQNICRFVEQRDEESDSDGSIEDHCKNLESYYLSQFISFL